MQKSDFYFDLPQELIAQEGIYKKIYDMQSAGGEAT